MAEATKIPHKKALFMAKRNLMKSIGDKLLNPWIELEELIKQAAKDTNMNPYFFLDFVKEELDIDNLYDEYGQLLPHSPIEDEDEDEDEGEDEESDGEEG